MHARVALAQRRSPGKELQKTGITVNFETRGESGGSLGALVDVQLKQVGTWVEWDVLQLYINESAEKSPRLAARFKERKSGGLILPTVVDVELKQVGTWCVEWDVGGEKIIYTRDITPQADRPRVRLYC